MADDIIGKLFSSYNDATTNIDSDKSAVNKAVGKTVATKSMSEYKKEMEEIKKIRNAESNRYKELFKSELELGKYSQKVKSDLLRQENNHYNDVFNLRNKLHEKQVTILEEERNIRAEIAKSGKASLGDLASLYTKRKQLEELEKQSIEYKEQQFKKGVDTVKKGFETIINHVLTYINERDNLMVWNQWETGIKDLGSQYEKNFTEIAARNGSDTQMETHLLIKDALSTVTNNPILEKGLNFNNDVFPAITEAVKHGFTGDDATTIAITNAIDKKIVPWLDTSSETWVNLQYNLSDNALAQLKGQQLLLQETKEGNRILQNGVVSALLDSLAPTLLNIDANTTDVNDLSGQAQNLVASLMKNGYSKQDAIKVANQTIDAYQNPFQNLSENSTTWQKLLAIGGLQGNDLGSAMTFATNAISPFNNGTWQAGGAVAANLGVPTNGLTRNTNYIQDLIDAASAASNYNGGDLLKAYNLSKLSEYTTATQQNDNEKQNEIANQIFDRNLAAHGVDLAAMQLNELKSIKTWLITGLTAWALTNLTNKLTDGFVSKFMSKLNGGKGISGLVGKGKGLLSGNATGLAKFSGIAGAALGTGVALAGINDAKAELNFAKNENNLTIDREKAKTDATEAGVAAGIGAIGAGVALFASGPIGLAIAALGAGALAFKKYNDHLDEVRDATGLLTQEFTNAKQKIKEEHDARDSELRSIRSTMHGLNDTSEKLEYLKEKGLNPTISATQLQTMTTEQINQELDKYLNNLILENKNDSNKDIKNVDDIGGDIKTQYNKDVKELKDQIYGQLKGKSQDEQYEMLSSLGYSDEELDALFRNKHNGAATDGELWRFLDKGGKFADKKNIESFSNKIDSGKITADDVNSFSNIYITHYDAPTLFDKNKMTGDEIHKVYTAAEYLYDYRAYGRSEDPIKTNVPHEFNQSQYDNMKEYLTNLDRDYNTILTKTFNQLGYSKDVTPESLKVNKEFRLGSTYIPSDMIAQLHAGERVLTEGQNKKYTEELVSGNSTSSMIQSGVQDIVMAIKTQTSEIINYLSTMSFSNMSFATSEINMHPSFGNTKVTR